MTAQTASKADTEAILRLVQRFDQAWDEGDAGACAGLFTPEGTLMAADGTFCQGHEELAEYYHRQLDGPYQHLRISDFKPLRLVYLDATTAVLDATWTMTDPEHGQRIVGYRPYGTWILQKNDSGWRFAAVRVMVPVGRRPRNAEGNEEAAAGGGA